MKSDALCPLIISAFVFNRLKQIFGFRSFVYFSGVLLARFQIQYLIDQILCHGYFSGGCSFIGAISYCLDLQGSRSKTLELLSLRSCFPGGLSVWFGGAV